MSARGQQFALLAATTPATTTTATTAFKAYGNSLTLQVTTVTGGGGTLTLNLRSSNDGTTYYKVMDLDSEVQWTNTDINTAGTYEFTLPVSLIPNQYYTVYYYCTNAAGTIAINAISWENPAGNVDVQIGDIHADIDSIKVDVGNKPAITNATGSAAINTTTAVADHFKLHGLSVHLSAAGTTSEALTATLNANDGAAYDTVLWKVADTSSGSPTDFAVNFSPPIVCESGDEIIIAWPNTETRTYGLRIVTEVI